MFGEPSAGEVPWSSVAEEFSGSGDVLCDVDTSQRHDLLAHRGLLYGSEEEFLASALPFIRDGLNGGDAVCSVSTERTAGWLRRELGTDASSVEFHESSRWYQHPVRALATAHRLVQATIPGGRQLRVLAEPLWVPRGPQEKKEWVRYESLVNAAFAGTNVAFVCSYDTRVVDPDFVGGLARTHPEMVVSGHAQPNLGYVEPEQFNAECNSAPLPELPAPALWLSFHRVNQLAVLRDFVTSHAFQAGATVQSTAQFVQAVDEVATNAIEHGGGSGVLQVWPGPESILCQVSDSGAGLRNPLDGHLPPGHRAARGRGLWLARQFSDLVELHSDPEGTTVRLHLDLGEGRTSPVDSASSSTPQAQAAPVLVSGGSFRG
ncbi:MAG TPA: sensor histidine kinase [Pseudonocardiaceae bacterium]|jgi:anti-sigma regulatory factor (Ser/Thr protein kinase)